MVGQHLERHALTRHQLAGALVHLTVVNAQSTEDGERLKYGTHDVTVSVTKVTERCSLVDVCMSHTLLDDIIRWRTYSMVVIEGVV